MGTGNKFDPTKLKIMGLKKTSYDPLAKVIRHEINKLNISVISPVKKSSYTTRIIPL